MLKCSEHCNFPVVGLFFVDWTDKDDVLHHEVVGYCSFHRQHAVNYANYRYERYGASVVEVVVKKPERVGEKVIFN